MSEATVRAQVKTILETVSGIGAVWDWDRTNKSWAAVLELMKSAGAVNGWTISRVKVRQAVNQNPALDRGHVYEINGLMAVDDENASEKTTQALVDAILDTFWDNPQLNGTCRDSDPVQVEEISYVAIPPREPTAIVYHAVRMTLVAWERII